MLEDLTDKLYYDAADWAPFYSEEKRLQPVPGCPLPKTVININFLMFFFQMKKFFDILHSNLCILKYKLKKNIKKVFPTIVKN